MQRRRRAATCAARSAIGPVRCLLRDPAEFGAGWLTRTFDRPSTIRERLGVSGSVDETSHRPRRSGVSPITNDFRRLAARLGPKSGHRGALESDGPRTRRDRVDTRKEKLRWAQARLEAARRTVLGAAARNSLLSDWLRALLPAFRSHTHSIAVTHNAARGPG